MKPKLSASILSADFANLEQSIRSVLHNEVGFLHIDVMDGHFVPNISFGSTVMKSLTDKDLPKFDVHLMIENPDKYIDDFLTIQTEYITFHYETLNFSLADVSFEENSKFVDVILDTNLKNLIAKIKNRGIKAGLAINPDTDINVLTPFLGDLDMVLLMSVHPGFSGQSFIPKVMNKVESLYKLRKAGKFDFLIEVDGGINEEIAKELISRGVDILVMGSYLFENNDRKINIFK